MNDWTYRLENFSLWFQGGVRRNIIVLLGIAVILLFPMYLLGGLLAKFWDTIPANATRSDTALTINNVKIKKSEPIIARSQIIELINNENILYTSINNSVNKNIGFYPLVYNVQILDKQGAIITDETKISYLLPEEVKYVMANSNDGGSEIKISIDWDKTVSKKYNPNSINRLKTTKINIRNASVTDIGKDVKVYGILKNEENFGIQSLDVNYILRDARDNVVGIGTYQFNGLEPNKERELNVLFPKHKDKTATSLDLRYSINYLEPNNLR